MTDDEISKLFDNELKPARAMAAAFDRVDAALRAHTCAELLFHTKKRHSYVYETIPYGRGRIGFQCYDPNLYDGPESDIGTGATREEALTDYLEKIDREPEPVRAGVPFAGNGNSEPIEMRDEPYRDVDLENQE